MATALPDGATMADFTAIHDLLDGSVQLLDGLLELRPTDLSRFEKWLELFPPTARYQVIAIDGVTDSGSYIIDVDRNGLSGQIDLLKEPDRVREKAIYRHLATWGALRVRGPKEYTVVSPFLLFETRNSDGISRLAYVGTYDDLLVQSEGRWRIQKRRVLLDTSTFRLMVLPI
jgi:3-phenylpropionate/cinnamic acid dioxygenase small subunit